MEPKKVLEILHRAGAILTDDHFVLTSGNHASKYVNKDSVYLHPPSIARLCMEIAEEFQDYNIDTVVGPAMGGIILAQWTSFYLTTKTGVPVFAVFADKAEGDQFAFKRGYDEYVSGKKVLVVEDILTTGGSVKKVIELVRNTGGEVAGVGALCNRGSVTSEELGVKLIALASLDLPAWPAEYCKLCEDKVPVNIKLGKGKEFLARKGL